MAAKKVVLKLHVYNEKEKQKALKKVSGLSGIESIAMDMKEKKLTVVGDVDPIQIVMKLKKHWYTEILTAGPAAKETQKKPDDKNKEIDHAADLLWRRRYYHYDYNHDCYEYHYYNRGRCYYSSEENPNSCVIC